MVLQPAVRDEEMDEAAVVIVRVEQRPKAGGRLEGHVELEVVAAGGEGRQAMLEVRVAVETREVEGHL